MSSSPAIDVELSLGSLARRHRRRLAEYAALAAVGAAPSAAMGWVLRWAVDAAVAGEQITIAVVVVVAALVVMSFVAYWRLGQVIGHITTEIREDADTRILSGLLARAVSDASYRPSGGSELARYGSLYAGLLIDITQRLPQTVTGFALVAGVAVAAPELWWVPVATIAVSVALTALAVRLVRPVDARSMDATDVSGRVLAEAVGSVRDVVAYNAFDLVMGRARRAFATEGTLRESRARRQTLVGAVSGMSSIVILVAAAFAATALHDSGQMTQGAVVGGITQAAAAHAALAASAMWLGTILVRVEALGAVVADRTAPLPDVRRGAPAPAPVLACENVTFAWGAVPIVDGFDLVIGPGEHVAVVGPSGIGKSTLAGLLTGLVAPDSGRVLLDGVEVGKHPASHTTIAVLPQESYVFAGTLRENVELLSGPVGDAEVAAAARLVGLDRVVDRLGGLDASVDPRTSGLSSGERQLICLTRAYLAPARIIICDEGTCYLDPVAEETAERALASRPDTTLVVVAHRISSARRAHRVVVMGAGVEVGTHDQLLAANDLYASLNAAWDLDPAAVETGR